MTSGTGGQQVVSLSGLPIPAPAPPAARHRPEEALTPRELEALQWLAQGLGNKQIAAKYQVAAVMGKLGATNRTEAAAFGLRRGPCSCSSALAPRRQAVAADSVHVASTAAFTFRAGRKFSRCQIPHGALHARDRCFGFPWTYRNRFSTSSALAHEVVQVGGAHVQPFLTRRSGINCQLERMNILGRGVRGGFVIGQS